MKALIAYYMEKGWAESEAQRIVNEILDGEESDDE